MIVAFRDINLRILVFGPSCTITHAPGFTADLATKRGQIRDALNGDGHTAVFPEDLMHGSIDPLIDNPYIWEQLLVKEYDMVVNLVGSFGAVTEMSLFMRENLALKAALFFNQDHCGGLHFQQAKAIEALGATLETYVYPDDLASCNLMKRVRAKVWAVRVGKFMNS
jgi:hypothetical protein